MPVSTCHFQKVPWPHPLNIVEWWINESYQRRGQESTDSCINCTYINIYIYILWLHNIYINILWSIYSILIYIILYLLSFNYFYIFSSNLYEIAARLPTAMSWDPLRPHASQLQCRRKRPSKVLIHRSRKSNKKLSFGRKYRDSMWFRYSENAFWDWVKYIEIYWFPGLICWQMFQIWVWVGGESPTGTHLRGIPGIILKSNN